MEEVANAGSDNVHIELPEFGAPMLAALHEPNNAGIPVGRSILERTPIRHRRRGPSRLARRCSILLRKDSRVPSRRSRPIK